MTVEVVHSMEDRSENKQKKNTSSKVVEKPSLSKWSTQLDPSKSTLSRLYKACRLGKQLPSQHQ